MKKDLFLLSAAMKRRKKKKSDSKVESEEALQGAEKPVVHRVPELWKTLFHTLAVPVTLIAFVYLKRRLT